MEKNETVKTEVVEKTQEQIQAEVIALKAAIFDVEQQMKQLVSIHKKVELERKELYKKLNDTAKLLKAEVVDDPQGE